MFTVRMVDGTEFIVTSEMNIKAVLDRLNSSYVEPIGWISFLKDDGKEIIVPVMQIDYIVEL